MNELRDSQDDRHFWFAGELKRAKNKLAAIHELIDGLTANDFHRMTGTRYERCCELLEVIRER
jgi:hypothetical protein